MKQVIKHRDGGLLGRSGDSRRSGDSVFPLGVFAPLKYEHTYKIK